MKKWDVASQLYGVVFLFFRFARHVTAGLAFVADFFLYSRYNVKIVFIEIGS